MSLARHHSGSHAGPRHLGGDVLCLDGKVGRAANDVRVILAGGLANADDMIGRLLAPWLSDSFGYAYAENRTCSDGNLAIEAFYDMFHVHFGAGRNCFGIVAMMQCTADEFRCLTELESLELKFRGLARAHPSMSAQRVQVILEDLPGALEFIGSSRRRGTARLRLVGSATRSERSNGLPASAWYGFGVLSGKSADIIATISRKIDARPARASLKY